MTTAARTTSAETASPVPTNVWPITMADVLAAHARIRPHVPPSPLRRYPLLDEAVGRGIAVYVKHENLNPTGAFKIRNGISLMTMLPAGARGVVAATRGNHGLGIAWAGTQLGIPVTLCVPVGNNAEKNAMMRSYGARVIEQGADYDEAVVVAERLVREEGLHLAHSTNDRMVIAGAATYTLEILEEVPDLDAMVIAVGGGSQAVGALTVARSLRPELTIYGVQAAGAAAAFESWRAGRALTLPAAQTFADGLATRSAYAMTFPALREGLAGFVTVTDAEIAEALRLALRTTHTLVEGAGAAGLAGLLSLRDQLAGRKVAVVFSGANIDAETLGRVLRKEI